MKYRPLDKNGDYVLGQPFLSNTPATVGQAVLTRLRLWLGEFFANTADGTSWMTEVLGPRSRHTPDAAIKDRILGTPGVTGLAAYSSSYDGKTRVLIVSATINTLYGTVTISEALK